MASLRPAHHPGPDFGRALGALLGVLAGDAAGATLEFYGSRDITADVAYHAMRMPGGGVFNVAPGQITDDGELTVALARALITAGRTHQATSAATAGTAATISSTPLGSCETDVCAFPADALAAAYAAWMQSNPFDVGNTCRAAFTVPAGGNTSKSLAAAEGMCARALHASAQSQANGALMRAAPLALRAAALGLSDAATVAWAHADAALSHPHIVVKDCNAMYVLALRHLLLNRGDNVGAIERAERYAHDEMAADLPAHDFSNGDGPRRWMLEDSRRNWDNIDSCRQNIGHVKHAFTLAMHLLRECAGYEEGIQAVLMRHGDTDTNAAIAGGLLGALHGVADGSKLPGFLNSVLHGDREGGIPEYMWRPVLTRIPKGQGYDRPAGYSSADAVQVVHDLLTVGIQPCGL